MSKDRYWPEIEPALRELILHIVMRRIHEPKGFNEAVEIEHTWTELAHL